MEQNGKREEAFRFSLENENKDLREELDQLWDIVRLKAPVFPEKSLVDEHRIVTFRFKRFNCKIEEDEGTYILSVKGLVERSWRMFMSYPTEKDFLDFLT